MYTFIMNKKMLSIIIILILFVLFLTKVFPKINFYTINSDFDGGCINICENEKEIKCSGSSCTYMCLGNVTNSCNK